MKRIFTGMMAVLLMAGAAMAQTDGLAVTIGYSDPIFRDKSTPGWGRGEGGLKGDYNLEGVTDKIIYKGVKVGLMYDATIIKGFGVTMGLNYSFGVNMTSWISSSSIYNSSRVRSIQYMHSLEIPVDWQYKFSVAKDTYIILYTGPTMQAMLYGRDKNQKQDYQGRSVTAVFDTFSDKPLAEGGYDVYASNWYNVLWGVGAGFQYDRYYIRGGYDFGLINTYKCPSYMVDDDTRIRLSGRLDQWQIKLGVYLWSPEM